MASCQTAFTAEHLPEQLEGAEVASTLLIVAGLASPDFLVELEAVAAAPAL